MKKDAVLHRVNYSWGLRVGLSCGVVAIAIACGTAVNPPSIYQMAFAENSAQIYSPTSCTPSEPYCKAWQPSSRTFSGTLTQTGLNVALSGDGSWSGPVTSNSNNTEQMTLARSGCGQFVISLYYTADGVAGTWTETSDCHGLQEMGTFTGHP